MKSRSTRHRTALSHVLHASDIFRRFSPEVAQSVRRPDITNQSYLEQAKKARQMLREMKPGQVLQMIEVHKDLEFVDALELAKRENKIIIPNYAAAKILEILRYQENDPRPSFMLWSGTLIIYEKPDEPFEDKIVFTWQHASIYYTIVFDIPEQFRGKRNCALVVEHPDFVLTKIDDNQFELSVPDVNDIHLLRSVPKKTGAWHMPESLFGIPVGRRIKYSEGLGLSYLWRKDRSSFIGAIIHVYSPYSVGETFNASYVIQDVEARVALFGCSHEALAPVPSQ